MNAAPIQFTPNGATWLPIGTTDGQVTLQSGRQTITVSEAEVEAARRHDSASWRWAMANRRRLQALASVREAAGVAS